MGGPSGATELSTGPPRGVTARAARSVRVWADMVKLSHSVFALPFALMATFLAARHLPHRTVPYAGQLGLIVLCMVAARSVAMTFNRIVDARLDARNPRTAARPLPAGRITFVAAWAMWALSAVTFGIGCLGFYVGYGNALPMLLSGPVLVYLCGYSFTKRFTKWSHYYLGAALGLAPAASWVAIHPPSLGWPAVWLTLAVIGWVGGFDIIYACQDIEVDRRDGLHSLPARWGPEKALRIARLSHVLCVVCLVFLGVSARLGTLYALGVAATAVLLLIENRLVKPGDYRRVNLAFFTVNGLVGLVLGTLTIADVLLSHGSRPVG
ncbi:MAG: 4-hydroxybenzoate octaprenyltransferase [Planctomycetota bacterium]|nr:MAG: 4-hydroxybenzoate octaprenyltransferase [Planctomycetota bacterium]